MLKEEKINLNDETYDAIVLSEFDPLTGMTNKVWINKMDGMRVKIETPNKIQMYLTDSSVPKELTPVVGMIPFYQNQCKDR